MNLSRFAVTHRPVMILAVLAAIVMGGKTFLTMPRREDPEIQIRTAVIQTQWPGATTEKVEELVTDLIEEAVYGIDEVDEVRSQSRVGVSIVYVDLEETIYEIEQVWDEVRAEIAKIEPQLPTGCRAPIVNSNFGDVSAVCLALYQTPAPGRETIERSYTWRELEIQAEAIEKRLKAIPSVADVTIYGAQDEVITVEVNAADWAKIGVTRDDLKSAFEARNIVAPGGALETGLGRYSVKPSGEFESIAEFDEVVVRRGAGGVPIRMGDIAATITREYVDPMRKKLRFTSPDARADQALLIGLTMKAGRNIVEMGAEVDVAVREMQGTFLPPDLELTRINDLPRQVDTLIKDFVKNLWQAIAIVLLVAFLMMGWRPAVIMAAAVPLCMISAFSVVRLFNVELEQFSIASLIIALGMIVDNAIVVSDNAVSELRAGKSKMQAAIDGAHGLAIPILTSTLTTVAAFGPLLTIPGTSGEYMRSLPIVVSCTLLISWVVAMTVTPIFCFWLLKPPAQKEQVSAKPNKGAVVYDRLIRWCMGHKLTVLGSAGLALIGAISLVPLIGSQFFPGGMRDQFFVHIWLPEGAPLAETEAVCAEVEQLLLDTSAVDGVERLSNALTFVGMGGPRMMLTSSPEDDNPHYALIQVNTTDPTFSAAWADELRELVGNIAGARVDVRRFMLGPPIDKPVEFLLIGPDDDLLRGAAADMAAELGKIAGAFEPIDDWGNSGYQMEVKIDNAAADLAHVTNISVANTLADMFSGGYLTTFREGDHQVDVVLRIDRGQRTGLADLEDLSVNGSAGKVPLNAIADVIPTWQPALVRRFNNQRSIGVGCQVEPGYLPNDVALAIKPKFEEMVAAMPPGYRLEERGELYETSKSQKDVTAALQLSMILIFIVLISQYNSFAKPLIVLSAVPLALIGALIGLFVTGWPLGFMPSLGIVSLAGVVINNAIILLDFIETTMRAGTPLRDAVARAGAARMKPIVLTTLTTVGGLIPLALFGGPMWAGMSYAMIFGLVLSTALTLLVVPTIYVLFVEVFKMQPIPEVSQ